MSLRALIVDDEPPARKKIRKFLEARSDIEVVGESGDGVEAVEQALGLKPDLIFLDIQMPRGDGFDVLREVYPHHKLKVIFTTAYDQYAIRAFEVEAVDYLLKPFTAERFHQAVDRALHSLTAGPGVSDQLSGLLEQLRNASNRAQRLLIRGPGRAFFLKTADIEWVEAEEKYVKVHTRGERHLLRQSMTALEAQLSHASFVRIHRCYLVNLEALKEVVPWAHGDYVCVLKSGVRLNIGRNYREGLMRAMGDSSAAAAC